MHDGFGRDDLVLAALAVAQLDAFVAEDGNVAGAAARRLLELALEAAPGEFESCRVAGAAGVGGGGGRGLLLSPLGPGGENGGAPDPRGAPPGPPPPPPPRPPPPAPRPRPPPR